MLLPLPVCSRLEAVTDVETKLLGSEAARQAAVDELRTLRCALADKETALSDATLKLGALTSECASADSKRLEAMTMLTEASSAAQSVAAQLAASQEEVARLHAAVAASQDTVVELKKAKASAEARADVAARERDEAVALVATGTKQAIEFTAFQKSQQDTHEKAVLKLHSEVEALKDVRAELETEIRRLKLELDCQSRELRQVTTDNTALGKLVKSLQAQCAEHDSRAISRTLDKSSFLLGSPIPGATSDSEDEEDYDDGDGDAAGRGNRSHNSHSSSGAARATVPQRRTHE